MTRKRAARFCGVMGAVFFFQGLAAQIFGAPANVYGPAFAATSSFWAAGYLFGW